MSLLNNRKGVCSVFSPELVTAARLILTGLVFIVQINYHVCRIFIVQFEETTQDRQLEKTVFYELPIFAFVFWTLSTNLLTIGLGYR